MDHEPEKELADNDQNLKNKFPALFSVTPLAKYLAMVIFIIMPFVGGYIGYRYGKNEVTGTVSETTPISKDWALPDPSYTLQKQKQEEERYLSELACGDTFYAYKVAPTSVLYCGGKGQSIDMLVSPQDFETIKNIRTNDTLVSYGRSKNHVFYNGVVIPDADPQTFTLALDKNDYYFEWAVDDRHVYFNGRLVEGADVATFHIIQGLNTKDCGYASYAADVDRVYYGGLPIIGADPQTFEILTNAYSKDKENVYYGNQKTDYRAANGDYCGIG